MKCPKCGLEMDQGRGSSGSRGGTGMKPEFFWASCVCGLYIEAETQEKLEERLRPAERQEIGSDDVGKVEDIL